MYHLDSIGLKVGFAALLGSLLSGCGGSDPPPGCALEDTVCGVCAGVPAATLCEADACTSDVSCSSVVEANDAASLSSAIADATAGACIALAPGSYGEANLPGGVSLLGKSSSSVKIEKITLGPGQGAVLRGLGVGPGGIRLTGAKGVKIDSVRVSGSADNGIDMDATSEATLVASEITGSARYGLYATGQAAITVEKTLISNSQGPGIWVECSSGDGCACMVKPEVHMKTSIIRENRILGVSLSGATAAMECVDIVRTKAGDKWSFGQYGGGLSASGCSHVDAIKMRSTDNIDWGALIDNSTAVLGTMNTPGDAVELSRNFRGLWVQNVKNCPLYDPMDPTTKPCVEMHEGTIDENRGVGVGASGESHGIIVCKGQIKNTKDEALPVYDQNNIGAFEVVGDGFDWLENSQVILEEVNFESNQRGKSVAGAPERADLLIDGDVAPGSALTHVQEVGGDPNTAFVQQLFKMKAPDLTGVTLNTNPKRQFSIAKGLSSPSGI